MTNSVGRSPTCASPSRTAAISAASIAAPPTGKLTATTMNTFWPELDRLARVFCTSVFERFASPAVSRSRDGVETTSPSPCSAVEDLSRLQRPLARRTLRPTHCAGLRRINNQPRFARPCQIRKHHAYQNRSQGHGRIEAAQNSRLAPAKVTPCSFAASTTMKSNPSQNLRASAA